MKVRYLHFQTLGKARKERIKFNKDYGYIPQLYVLKTLNGRSVDWVIIKPYGLRKVR